MAYRTSKGKSSILAPNSKEVISFMSTGAIPVPRLGISREIETGSFSYNFNLNFGSSFEEFVSKSSEIMDNSYVSTAKGRSVLLSHILNSKVIWLGVASNVNGGTSFPIFSYSQKEENTSQSSNLSDFAFTLLLFTLSDLPVLDLFAFSTFLLQKVEMVMILFSFCWAGCKIAICT